MADREFFARVREGTEDSETKRDDTVVRLLRNVDSG